MNFFVVFGLWYRFFFVGCYYVYFYFIGVRIELNYGLYEFMRVWSRFLGYDGLVCFMVILLLENVVEVCCLCS